MATLTVYTQPNCQPCKATLRLAARLGHTIIERPLAEVSAQQLAAFRQAGFRSAPVVIAEGGQAWAGYRPDLLKTL